jgi:uncharacterized MnhB-related membrane protein
MGELVLVVLGVVMVAGALLALYAKDLTSAVVANGVVSLFTSILFLILASPDVAMTEAAVGAALTTVVFILALNKVRKGEKEEDRG